MVLRLAHLFSREANCASSRTAFSDKFFMSANLNMLELVGNMKRRVHGMIPISRIAAPQYNEQCDFKANQIKLPAPRMAKDGPNACPLW